MIIKKYPFVFLFVLILIAAIFTCYMEWQVVHYAFRILIVPSLLYLLFINYRKFEHPLIPLLFTATFFKFLGDIFFMIDVEIVLFRLFAICTFTVANIGYGLLFFFSCQNKRKIKADTYYLPEIIFTTIILITLFTLVPYFGLFQIPALIYLVFTCFSLIAMARRRKFLKKKTYLPVLAGTVFFLTSDILHGLSVHYQNPIHDIMILVSFSLGHYFVLHGMAIQFQDETKIEKVMMKTII